MLDATILKLYTYTPRTPRKNKYYRLVEANFEQLERHLLIKLLQTSPFRPSSRTKKIKGFDGLFECSVNMDIRILWRYEGTEIIITLDNRHHSVVDKLYNYY